MHLNSVQLRRDKHTGWLCEFELSFARSGLSKQGWTFELLFETSSSTKPGLEPATTEFGSKIEGEFIQPTRQPVSDWLLCTKSSQTTETPRVWGKEEKIISILKDLCSYSTWDESKLLNVTKEKIAHGRAFLNQREYFYNLEGLKVAKEASSQGMTHLLWF